MVPRITEYVNFSSNSVVLEGHKPGILSGHILTFLSLLLLTVGVSVHRALFKVLRKLKSRYINQIVYPPLV